MRGWWRGHRRVSRAVDIGGVVRPGTVMIRRTVIWRGRGHIGRRGVAGLTMGQRRQWLSVGRLTGSYQLPSDRGSEDRRLLCRGHITGHSCGARGARSQMWGQGGDLRRESWGPGGGEAQWRGDGWRGGGGHCGLLDAGRGHVVLDCCS